MKLIPKLQGGKKLLKGEDNAPVLIPMGPANEYSMTPEGQFTLLDPKTGKWLFFDDMATRDSLDYQWYPFETTAPASAFSNGIPNREDPFYKKALELAEKQKKANKSEKKTNKSEKKRKGGTMIDNGVLPSRITKLAQKGDGIYANDPYGNHDPYALKKGGIVKGQDDLDTFDIIKESKKLPRKNPSNPVYIPKVTRNVKPEYELPDGTFPGEPGFFVGSDTIPPLQDRGFVIPVNEGEEAIKRFKDRFKKRTVATPLAYKKD